MESRESHRLLVPWVYDLGVWIFSLCLEIFFRETYPRGAWRVPKEGPVIIIAAPHANQFVDSVLLMHILKKYANRRVSFLIAGKSMREPYIGTIAGYMGALPVERAMDNVRPGEGTIYLPDPENDPTLVRGKGTNFSSPEFMVGGSLILPKAGKQSPESQAIAEIIGPEELRLRKTFVSVEKGEASDMLRTGSAFNVAPHIDQSDMFNAVFRELSDGGCIGIFPEGGSHDRTELLPLKAGAAIMALGALAQNPECGLSIIPCGMNYFHPHKFRSRAVIEFGNPIQVHPDQIKAYKAGGSEKRNAVGSLLETIYEGLAAVTQLSPDHETLTLIQATRRLYQPIQKKFLLPFIVELNRRLLQAYAHHQNDPQVIKLKKAVKDYNRRLRALGIKDHQVEWGNYKERPWILVFFTLIYRLCELVLLVIGTIPSLALFWPVFVITKVISSRKQRKALAASVVKLRGRDVVGTWKILVAMGLAPLLYTYYIIIVTAWLHYCRQKGHYCLAVPWWMNPTHYIPGGVRLPVFAVFFFGLMISVTFAGLRIGEVGMDVLKSLPPLILALNPWSYDSLVELRKQRQALSIQVAEAVNVFGPGTFPDFEAERVVDDPLSEDVYQSQLKVMPRSKSRSRVRDDSQYRSGNRSTSTQDGSLRPLTSSQLVEALEEVQKGTTSISGESVRSRAKTADGDRTGQSHSNSKIRSIDIDRTTEEAKKNN